MDKLHRAFYFLITDSTLDDLTVNLDGGRCYAEDLIRVLHLPYKKCHNFQAQHIASLSKLRVKKLLHFIRLSNEIDRDSVWIFNLKAKFMRIIGETFS